MINESQASIPKTPAANNNPLNISAQSKPSALKSQAPKTNLGGAKSAKTSTLNASKPGITKPAAATTSKSPNGVGLTS